MKICRHLPSCKWVGVQITNKEMSPWYAEIGRHLPSTKMVTDQFPHKQMTLEN